MTSPENHADAPPAVPTPDQNLRVARLRAAAQDAADRAVLGVSAIRIVEMIMRYSSVAPTVDELRYAMTLVHNATITLPQEDTP